LLDPLRTTGRTAVSPPNQILHLEEELPLGLYPPVRVEALQVVRGADVEDRERTGLVRDEGLDLEPAGKVVVLRDEPKRQRACQSAILRLTRSNGPGTGETNSAGRSFLSDWSV
jgi:hypothetical protein